MIIENGIKIFDYYLDDNVREICKEVKSNNKRCIKLIADFLSSNKGVDSNSILIPSPNHFGYADYTLEIAKLIAEKTNAKIADVLKCKSHESLYSQKQNGKITSPIEMYLIDKFECKNKKLFFIDNVISTGMTLDESRKLIKNIKPLVFAMVKIQ